MSSKHTPRPWLPVMYGDRPWDGQTTEYVGISTPNDGASIINGCGECGSPWINNPADLTLMTAAPDLLDWAHKSQHADLCATNDFPTKACDCGRDAAIAKAEGVPL